MAEDDGKIISDKALVFRTKSGKPFVLQSCSTLDELYEYKNPIEKKFFEFVRLLAERTGAKFVPGDTKERETAENKIKRACLGKATLISDIVRAKIVVDCPEAIAELSAILNPGNTEEDPLLKQFGAYCAQINNHFERPKRNTGYRCLNAKISFPFKLKKDDIAEFIKYNDGDDEEIPTWRFAQDLPKGADEADYDDAEYIVELQVVHKDIEALYHRTHFHMRQAQNVYGKYKGVVVPNNQATKAAAHYAVCEILHNMAAQNAGLDELLKNKFDVLSPKRERLLRTLCGKYRLQLEPE